MALERRWRYIPPIQLSQDGGQDGLVVLADTIYFKVKQKIKIQALGEPDLLLEVKRVISPTRLYVGPLDTNINSRKDISAYTVAKISKISAEEQDKKVPGWEDQHKHSYEQEPILARRVIHVDPYGDFYTVSNPLPVQLSDGAINIGSVNAELEVQLSHKDNVPNAGDVADSTQVGDGVEILQINPDGSITVAMGGVTGTLKIHREAGAITNVSETTVSTLAVTADNTAILKVKGDAQTLGTWRMYRNTVAPANLLNVTKTSFNDRNGIMKFEQPEIFNNGDSLIVTFEAERYRAEFLGASSSTFTKIEGFTP